MSSEENISFSNCRGDTLSAILHHPVRPNADGAVILCHGMDSDKNSEKLIFLARQLAGQGILALRFDFSYVGESEGEFLDLTVSGEVEDLPGAWAFPRGRIDGPIGLTYVIVWRVSPSFFSDEATWRSRGAFGS